MREDPERRYPLSFLREHSSFRRQTGRYGYEAQCEKSAGGGSVAGITEGQINGLVRLRLLDGHLITANISMKAIEWMQLKEDKPVYAVIKATEVMVAAEPVRISARNQLPGRIVDLLEGTGKRYGVHRYRKRDSRSVPPFPWSRSENSDFIGEWMCLRSSRPLLS